jgi:hypothetical protein
MNNCDEVLLCGVRQQEMLIGIDDEEMKFYFEIECRG